MVFKLLQRSLALSPERFYNRELSLLKFHERVLDQAVNSAYPLLERLRFLSISGSNLDEFYMVRFAGLKAGRLNEDEAVSIDGLGFKRQLALLYPRLKDFRERQQRVFAGLGKELANSGFHIIGEKDLGRKEREKLKAFFDKELSPVLSPAFEDEKGGIPFIANMGLYFLVEIDGRHAVIPLPTGFERFVRLKGSRDRYIALEDVIGLFLPSLFSGKEFRYLGFFTVIRDYFLNFEEPAGDLIAYFEQVLTLRKQGKIVLLNVRKGFDPLALLYLVKQLGVEEQDIAVSDFIGYRHLASLAGFGRKDLLFKEYAPRKPERVRDFGGDHFKAVAKKDMIIHHPYESYEVVVNFLKQAAMDKDVTVIKQTLYRTNKQSPVMNALIDAAKAGKDVTAVIEVRARFDEEANLAWARRMRENGVKVVFGHPKYKFHGKVSLVERMERGVMKRYVHYGTGNYNPVTASIYTDLSFFTCDEALAEDAHKLFRFLETRSSPEDFKKLVISPYGIQAELLYLIGREAALAREGRKAKIWMKANALTDDKIIDALYKASQAGVEIKLVIRGTCVLRPGVKGLSENISVRSIIGRYLEHSRIYCFSDGHKMPSSKTKVFISSADLMRRNMVRRIETLVPVENATVHSQVLKQIMLANLKDQAGSYEADGDLEYRRPGARSRGFSAQEFFMNNPSLSGRGSAKLKKHIAKTKK